MGNTHLLDELKPEEVFKYFREICAIPHGSGNVEKISNYCVEFAKKNNLSYRQDESFNVIIRKPATTGYEERPAVIIQGHIDMVAVKTLDCTKNLENEGLDLEYADGYLYAKGTSLGADDGIAVAYALAILASDTIEHPALEAVFTVDEEIGLLGATALDMSDVKGRIMLNIDSEEEGIFVAGCAGGATARCTIPVERKVKNGVVCEVTLDNLTGGHSGVEIICQRGNANVLLGRLLNKVLKSVEFRIISVSGGEKDNAIAKSATAKVLVKKEHIDTFVREIKNVYEVIKAEYVTTDPSMTVEVKVGSEEEVNVMKGSSARRVLTALTGFPNGILKMSNDIAGLVQTSLNLGILESNEDSVSVSYSVRSAVSSEKEELLDRLECLTASLNGTCEVSGVYPAWEYQRESRLRDVMVAAYKDMYGKEPLIQTIHAGLECGVIADKIPGLDCVSFGPDIKDIHTTKEMLDVASAERTWNLILDVLKRI